MNVTRSLRFGALAVSLIAILQIAFVVFTAWSPGSSRATPFASVLPAALSRILPSHRSWPGWERVETIAVLAAPDAFLGVGTPGVTDLEHYLEQMTGRDWAVVAGDVAGPAIRLAVDPAHPSLAGRGEEAVYLTADDTGIRIVGTTSLAARHGVYLLLDTLGVRWFFKNAAWEFVPESIPPLPDLDVVHEPAFDYRTLWYFETDFTTTSDDARERLQAWSRRNMYPGARWFSTHHSYAAIIPPLEADTIPGAGCGPTVDGPAQLDPLNATVLARAIAYAQTQLAIPTNADDETADELAVASVAIEPNDNASWCSRHYTGGALDIQAVTDDVWTLTANVAAAVQAAFPDQYVSTLGYSRHSGLPAIASFPANLLALQVTDTFVHSNVPFYTRLKHFKDRGAQIGAYDYPGRDSLYIKEYVDRIKTLNDLGGIVYYGEARSEWGERGLLYYAIARMMWDPTQDLDAILEDFYDKAFGPAKNVMERFYRRHGTASYDTRRVTALAFRDLAEAETMVETAGGLTSARRAEILERIRHLQYWLRWEWQGRWDKGNGPQKVNEDWLGVPAPYDLTAPGDQAAWTAFQCSLVSTNVLWNWFYLGGCDINTPPPSAVQAEGWMTEAITAFQDVPDQDPIRVDVQKTALSPFGDTGQPPYALSYFTGGTIYFRVNSVNGSDPNLHVQMENRDSYPILVNWYGPGNEVLFAGNVNGFAAANLDLPLTTPGVYTLTGHGGECCSQGSLRLTSGFENLPAAVDMSFFSKDDELHGYFYVPPGTEIFSLTLGDSNKDQGALVLTDANGAERINGAWTAGVYFYQNPPAGLWHVASTNDGRASIAIQGIPPLFWTDAETLLYQNPALLPGPTPIATPHLMAAWTPTPTNTPLPGTIPSLPTPTPTSTPTATPIPNTPTPVVPPPPPPALPPAAPATPTPEGSAVTSTPEGNAPPPADPTLFTYDWHNESTVDVPLVDQEANDTGQPSTPPAKLTVPAKSMSVDGLPASGLVTAQPVPIESVPPIDSETLPDAPTFVFAGQALQITVVGSTAESPDAADVTAQVRFNPPLRVSFSITDEEWAQAGMDPDAFQVRFFSVALNRWIEIPTEVDVTASPITVTGTTTHLTRFGLFQRSGGAVVVPPPDGGDASLGTLTLVLMGMLGAFLLAAGALVLRSRGDTATPVR